MPVVVSFLETTDACAMAELSLLRELVAVLVCACLHVNVCVCSAAEVACYVVAVVHVHAASVQAWARPPPTEALWVSSYCTHMNYPVPTQWLLQL